MQHIFLFYQPKHKVDFKYQPTHKLCGRQIMRQRQTATQIILFRDCNNINLCTNVYKQCRRHKARAYLLSNTHIISFFFILPTSNNFQMRYKDAKPTELELNSHKTIFEILIYCKTYFQAKSLNREGKWLHCLHSKMGLQKSAEIWLH